MKCLGFGPVQQAIYDALRTNTDLVAAVDGRIYDDVPQNEIFPYVSFGEFTSVSYRTHSGPGEEISVSIHVWSKYDGFKEAENIASIINSCLGDAPLEVVDHETIRCFFDYASGLRDTDNVRHITLRYRVLVRQV